MSVLIQRPVKRIKMREGAFALSAGTTSAAERDDIRRELDQLAVQVWAEFPKRPAPAAKAAARKKAVRRRGTRAAR
jgi:hypothetical protein